MADDEDAEEFLLDIFVSHGGSPLWQEVARFIENRLEHNVVVLKDQVNRGRTVIEKLEDETDECDFAIIVMTAEDEQLDGSPRARQNVIHEIGFCQGKFGRENVLVLKQDGVEEFSNIAGIVYESFSGNNISSTFVRIADEIQAVLDRYEEEEDSDEE